MEFEKAVNSMLDEEFDFSGDAFTKFTENVDRRLHSQKLLKLITGMEYGSYSVSFLGDTDTLNITNAPYPVHQMIDMLFEAGVEVGADTPDFRIDILNDTDALFAITDKFFEICEHDTNAKLYVTRSGDAFGDSFTVLVLDWPEQQRMFPCDNVKVTSTVQPMSFCDGSNTSAAANAETTAMGASNPVSFGEEEEQEMSFGGYMSRVLDDMHDFSEVVFNTLSQGVNKRKHLRKSVLNLIAEMERTDEYGTYSVSYLEDTNTVNTTNMSYPVDQMVSMLFDAGAPSPYDRLVGPADKDTLFEVIDKFFEVCEYYTDAKLYVTRIEKGAFKDFCKFLILDRKCQDIIARCDNAEVISTPQPMSFCEGLNTSVAAKAETTVENQQLQQGEVMSFVTFLSFCDLEQNDFGNILLSGIKRLYPQLYPVVKETYKVRVNESDTAAVKYLFQVLQAQSVDCTLAEGIEEDPNRNIVERAIGSITNDEWDAMCVAWNAYTSDPQLYKGSVVPDMVQAWLKDFRK